MLNALDPDPQEMPVSSDVMVRVRVPWQIVPAPTALQVRKSGGAGVSVCVAGGAADAYCGISRMPTAARRTHEDARMILSMTNTPTRRRRGLRLSGDAVA